MKKVSFMLIVLLPAMAAFAYEPNEKVLKAFTETFTHAENVKWEEYPDYYTVSFKTGAIQSKVIYNTEGVMLGAIRYYLPELLPLHILTAVKKEYKNKKPYCVTEVTRNNMLYYFIKLEDDNFWYSIQVTASGNSTTIETYRKG